MLNCRTWLRHSVIASGWLIQLALGLGISGVTTAAVPNVVTLSVQPAIVSHAYSWPLRTDVGGVTWTVTSGALPPGLALDPATGVVAGTATAGGDYVVGVTATNSDGPSTERSLRFRVRAVAPLVTWGVSSLIKRDLPDEPPHLAAVALGADHLVGIDASGAAVAWGANNRGQRDLPSGLTDVAGIAACEDHSIALRTDGTVAIWGDPTYGPGGPPAGLHRVTAVAIGVTHAVALQDDGNVVVWGYQIDQRTMPPGVDHVVAIAAGEYHTLALRANGTVIGWGEYTFGESDSPPDLTNAVDVAAGRLTSGVIRSDGSVLVWGYGATGQTAVPPTLANVAELKIGHGHVVARLTDRTVVAWGDDATGQATVQAGLAGAEAIGAGFGSAALAYTPPVVDSAAQATAVLGEPFTFRVTGSSPPTSVAAVGLAPGLAVDGATGVISGSPSALGSFPVALTITNPAGSAGATLTLDVVPCSATTWSLRSAAVGRPYATTLTALNATAVTWSVTSGSLPAGLALAPTTGVLSGTPSADGDFAIGFTPSCGTGSGPERLIRLRVDSPAPIVGWGNYGAGDKSFSDALGPVLAITAARGADAAVRRDGSVAAWGDDTYGQADVPAGLGGVSAIAFGSEHALALLDDGTVHGWGGDGLGQATPPAGLDVVTAIAAGGTHSLALRADGTVVAWGDDSSYQCRIPRVVRDGRAIAIAAGGTHSLAVLADGTVVAWGDDGMGQTDVPVGLSGVIEVAAGFQHSLALKSDGTVSGWGGGPSSAPPAGLSGETRIAAGSMHSLARAAGGAVTCWGFDNMSQSTPPSGLSGVVAVAGGIDYSFALGYLPPVISTSSAIDASLQVPFTYQVQVVNGAATFSASGLPPGLGIDGSSGLVTGTPTSTGSYSVLLTASNPAGSDSATVTITVSDTHVTTFSLAPGILGKHYAATVGAVGAPPLTWSITSGSLPAGLALDPASGTISGTPLTGGDAVVGITVGTATGHSPERRLKLRVHAPAPVVAWGYSSDGTTSVPASAQGVVQLATGGEHVLALRSDGSVIAWGNGSGGATTVPGGLTNVVDVSAGWSHSLALRDDGTVACWGNGFFGQVAVPPGLTGVTSVSGGFQFSLALLGDGHVVAWGDNSHGQCAVPVGLDDAVAVAAGDYHALALRSDGSVIAWGENSTGQATVPGGLSAVTGIAAGYLHSLALLATGSVTAWGDNAMGESSVPPGLAGVTRVAVGLPLNMALLSDQTPVVWGYSSGPSSVPTGLSHCTDICPGGTYALALGYEPQSITSPTQAFATLGLGFTYRITTSREVDRYDAVGLPAGLSCDATTGVISGVPTVAGDFVVTLSATNPVNTSTLALTLHVEPCLVTTYSVRRGAVGRPYAMTLAASSATPVTWSVTSGALPGGLALDPASGAISGIPSVGGDFRFGVTASNVAGAGPERALRLRVAAASPVIAWGSNSSGQLDIPVTIPSAIAVAAGGFHSLGVTPAGAVVGWGSNDQGQTTIPAGLSQVIQVAAGYTSSLTLRDDGTVVGWGAAPMSTVPIGLSDVTELVAGEWHALALRSDGTVVAWGYDSAGETIVPAGLVGVTGIAAGNEHSAALLADGTVTAWGGNGFGESTVPAGLASVTDIGAGYYGTVTLKADGSLAAWGAVSSPLVPAPSGTGFSSLAVGPYTAFALQAGSIVAWGNNGSGGPSYPVGLAGVTAFSPGLSHTLALGYLPPTVTGPASAHGIVGEPFSCQVTTTNFPSTISVSGLPGGLVLDSATGVISGLPTTVGTYSPILTVSNVAGSGSATVTITIDALTVTTYSLPPGLVGHVYSTTLGALTASTASWSIVSGVLPPGLSLDPITGAIAGTPTSGVDASFAVAATNGTGVSPTRALHLHIGAPAPVVAWGSTDYGEGLAPAGLIACEVAAGQETSLALLPNATVRAWGFAGLGITTPPAGLDHVVAISAAAHALALRDDGSVVAWGDDGFTKAEVPVGLAGVTAVAAGGRHSLALRGDGTVVGWGYAAYAVPPASLPPLIAVACSDSHSLALTADGAVVAWGDNSCSQCTVPPGLANVVAIAAGRNHSLALKSDGTVIGWGSGNGQAILPAGLSGIVAIADGGERAAALRADGSVVAWGGITHGIAAAPSDLVHASAVSAGTWHDLALGFVTPVIVGPSHVSGVVGQPLAVTVFAQNVPSTFGATGLPGGLAIDPSTGAITGTPTTAGTVMATLSATNVAGTGSATATFTIAPPQPIVIGGLAATYDGLPHPVTVGTSPSGLAIAVTYDGSTTAPTSAGSYAVMVTIVEPGYFGSASTTLVIAPASLVATAADAARPFGYRNPVFAGTLVGLIGGDGITADYLSAADTSTPVGIYGPGTPQAIMPKLTDPLGKLANYTLTTVNGTLRVFPDGELPSSGATQNFFKCGLGSGFAMITLGMALLPRRRRR